MNKNTLQEALSGKLLNDEITIEKYVKLYEKIENLSEIKIGLLKKGVKGIKPAFRASKKFLQLSKNIKRVQNAIGTLKTRAANMPAGQKKTETLQRIANLEKRLVLLKRVRIGSYTGTGAMVVGRGIRSDED